ARRQGLSDQALDRLLVSIPADNLARAEERARFWPSEPPSTIAEAAPPADPAEMSPFLPTPLAPENAPSQVVDTSSEDADAPAQDPQANAPASAGDATPPTAQPQDP